MIVSNKGCSFKHKHRRVKVYTERSHSGDEHHVIGIGATRYSASLPVIDTAAFADKLNAFFCRDFLVNFGVAQYNEDHSCGLHIHITGSDSYVVAGVPGIVLAVLMDFIGSGRNSTRSYLSKLRPPTAKALAALAEEGAVLELNRYGAAETIIAADGSVTKVASQVAQALLDRVLVKRGDGEHYIISSIGRSVLATLTQNDIDPPEFSAPFEPAFMFEYGKLKQFDVIAETWKSVTVNDDGRRRVLRKALIRRTRAEAIQAEVEIADTEVEKARAALRTAEQRAASLRSGS